MSQERQMQFLHRHRGEEHMLSELTEAEYFALLTLEAILATLDDVNAALAKLQTDVTALVAQATPVDLQPVVDQVNAIDAQITPVLPPPA